MNKNRHNSSCNFYNIKNHNNYITCEKNNKYHNSKKIAHCKHTWQFEIKKKVFIKPMNKKKNV